MTALAEIKQAVSANLHVTIADIEGKRRLAHIAFARQVVYYAAKRALGWSDLAIAEACGVERSGVSYAIRQVQNAIDNREHRARHVPEIVEELSSRKSKIAA